MDIVLRPLERPGRVRRIAPFAVAAVVAFLAIPFPPAGVDIREYLAAGLTAAIIAGSLWFPWRRFPPAVQSIPALAYFAVIALLRDAEGGGSSGYAPLVLLPIFWLAIHGTRRQLYLALVLMAVVLIAPILLIGSPGYPDSEWRRALIWISVAPIVGLSTHRLVMRTREQAQVSAVEARTDALTGLPNRRTWDEGVGRALALAARTGSPLSIAIFDIDHFKTYNDTHGHQAGDRLLKEAASAWRQLTRETDLLARYGGEEFALVLPGAGLDQAREIVDRIRRATPDGVTCSAGVATWNGSEPVLELLGRADASLYEAKQLGRNRTAIAAA